MKRVVFSFLLLATIFSASLFAAEIQGKVIRVFDGDTIEVLHEKKPVRICLLNIEAPEKNQPFGNWSTNQLKKLIAEQPVTVTYTQEDRYGRGLWAESNPVPPWEWRH